MVLKLMTVLVVRNLARDLGPEQPLLAVLDRWGGAGGAGESSPWRLRDLEDMAGKLGSMAQRLVRFPDTAKSRGVSKPTAMRPRHKRGSVLNLSLVGRRM
jgi:hypothetical protein